MRVSFIAVALAGLAGCASAPGRVADCRIDPGAVRSWSEYHQLDDSAREARTVAYAGCGKRLAYVAAVHTNDPASGTFRQVAAAMAAGPQFVVLEGFPASFGTSPQGMVDYARSVAGKPTDAEPYLAIRLAAERGAGFTGGEPADSDVVAYARTKGLNASDVFAFYVLRLVEQWRREGRLTGPADPALGGLIAEFAAQFTQQAGVAPAEIASVSTSEGFKTWYRAQNGVAFDEGYRPEDSHPNGPGGRRTNVLSDLIQDARDRFIVTVVAEALSRHDAVLVVFGKSHLLIQGPAYERAFGPARELAGPA
jgi:hypothetical protein